ncbi:SMI1/KNR4 family protein [Burkholderia sp. 22PA0106]|uniref:SMI1/KNR4 family protein n=1 Tax=Burkholderia sp. 22PA0106 TaxID=3237371 RepID=UPI0039C1614B
MSLSKNSDFGVGVVISGPVLQEKIHSAELMLGVDFPNSYKMYLEKYGAIDVDARSFAGLTSNNAGDDGNVVAFTKYAREEYQLPVQYIALDFQDGDAFLCIDTQKKGTDGEFPVVLVNPIDGAQMGYAAAENWMDCLEEYLSS